MKNPIALHVWKSKSKEKSSTWGGDWIFVSHLELLLHPHLHTAHTGCKAAPAIADSMAAGIEVCMACESNHSTVIARDAAATSFCKCGELVEDGGCSQFLAARET